MDNNINNQEEIYVPEYKPGKYKKSSEVVKKISIVLFILMGIS